LVEKGMQTIQIDPNQQLYNILEEAFKDRLEEKYAGYLKGIIFETYKMYEKKIKYI
jgi:hypothetical protein